MCMKLPLNFLKNYNFPNWAEKNFFKFLFTKLTLAFAEEKFVKRKILRTFSLPNYGYWNLKNQFQQPLIEFQVQAASNSLTSGATPSSTKASTKAGSTAVSSTHTTELGLSTSVPSLSEEESEEEISSSVRSLISHSGKTTERDPTQEMSSGLSLSLSSKGTSASTASSSKIASSIPSSTNGHSASSETVSTVILPFLSLLWLQIGIFVLTRYWARWY